MQYIEGHQSAEGYHPLAVEDHYRQIYYEKIDTIIQAVMTRFDQPSFKAQCFIEQLLLKGMQGHDVTIEISEIKNFYGDGISFNSLPTELQVLKTNGKLKNRNHQTHVKL